MRLVLSWIATVWVVLGLAGALQAGTLEKLEKLQREHPSTPVVEALAHAYLENGRAGDAIVGLREHGRSHPETRPLLAGLLGRSLYENGDDRIAKTALQQALAADETDEDARLYLALTLWRLGEADEASRVLEEAGERSEELLAATKLARGLIAVGDGDLDRARVHLGTVVQEPAPRLSLQVYSGLEIDSNVLLDGGDVPGASTGKSDYRARYGATFAWRAQPAPTVFLQAAYRFDRTRHDEYEFFDLETHQGLLGARWFVSERVALEFSGGVAQHRLDHSSYLTQTLAGTGVLLDLHSWRGVALGYARLGASAERLSFHEDPILPSLERDGRRLTVDFQHHVPIPWGEETRISWGVAQGWRDTDGSRDLFGLDSAYDHRVTTLSLGGTTALPWETTLSLTVAASREKYDHRSVIDLLTDSGVGVLTPERRYDNVVQSELVLERPITRWATVELFVRRTHRISNVDLYDYERTVGGVLIRLSADQSARRGSKENRR